ncbi:MAG: glycosyltransferase [Desulfobulbaceae bacterium]|nr:glycosyltransferase [Desulfobulbaceae bacterium]
MPMTVLIYCQHVLGIGHLFRTLEIARALRGHRVVLVLGGPPVTVPMPSHVRTVQLPGLEMDAAFSALLPVDRAMELETVKRQRRDQLLRIAGELQPDVLLIELFPFGRNNFSFELLPLLEAVRGSRMPRCRVVSSVRDILVEKQDPRKFEQRVIDRLNRLFDAVLVHGDPAVISLDQTFSRMEDIRIPVVYTGYVCRRASRDEGRRLRLELGLGAGEKLLVASAGSGSVGHPLLLAAVQAVRHLAFPSRLYVFTGPYMDAGKVAELRRQAPANVVIERFAENFPLWLAAADLSLSMGGYNTTMDVLASGTPGLIYPFSQNREQRLRVEHLARIAGLGLLEDRQLDPPLLAGQIRLLLGSKPHRPRVRLDGAEFTGKWLEQWIRAK